MTNETRSVSLLGEGGSVLIGRFTLWEECPDNPDAVRLDLEYDSRVLSTTSENGFFEALCLIREMLIKNGLQPVCFGACENVYPSPMIQSMGDGDMAYRLTIGKQALLSDLVSIFDTNEGIVPVSVATQKAYFEKWISSL